MSAGAARKRHRRFTLAFAFGLVVIQRVRLRDRGLALYR